jgi:hypothetical protein
MSEARLTNRFTARRVAIAVAVACIVWALVVWLHRRDVLVPRITADVATVGPGGKIPIEGALVLKRTGAVAPADGCSFHWTATMGGIVGSGAKVVWSAPSVPESAATVSLVVRCDGESYAGSIDLATETVRPPSFLAERHYGGDDSRPPAAMIPTPQQVQEGEGAPVIDEIVMEKTSVCKGEDDLVSVRAHDPKTGESLWLRTTVGPGRGTDVPIVYTEDVKDPPWKIIVTGNMGQGTTIADVPHVTLMDCEAPWRVAVEHRLIPNTEDDFHFHARIIPKPGGQRFDACAYEWDFGDEQGASTNDPAAEHSYLDRPEVGLDSTFLVKVKIVSCDGNASVVGRTALTLNNTYAQQKMQKHISGLVIVGDPRYPQRGDDNVVRQTALLRTFEDSPVTITRITYVDTFESSPQATDPTEVSVSSFLGTTTLSREWTHVSLSMSLDDNPGWMMRRWDLEGTAADGDHVMGSFTLMKPVPRVDREHSPKIDDPAMKNRIMAAMRILGKDQVTEEDILALEEQGRIPKLANPEDHIPRPPVPAYVRPMGTDQPPPPNKPVGQPYVPPQVAAQQAPAGTGAPNDSNGAPSKPH